jgi:hypothetical protein
MGLLHDLGEEVTECDERIAEQQQLYKAATGKKLPVTSCP